MKIETVDYTASDAGERLARSLRETGFAVLANHPIRADRIDEAYALSVSYTHLTLPTILLV